MADGSDGSLRKRRALPADVAPPVFKLGGLAIGNGFTGEALGGMTAQARGRQWVRPLRAPCTLAAMSAGLHPFCAA